VAHWAALGAAIALPAVDPALSGAALRIAILEEKYTSLFLNPEVFNDYKRACMPWIVPVGGGTIPGRFFYPRAERETNRNIPAPGATPGFNENDPNRC
jgi:hypothetical protein